MSAEPEGAPPAVVAPERAGPVVVFDIETQHLFADVGGDRQTHKLLVAVAVSFDEQTGEYRVFTHDTAHELVEQLFSAGLVVGYNSIKFDYRVLKPYTKRRFNMVPTLDIFDHVYRRTNFRSKLDTIAAETLGTRKTGNGLEANAWFKAGEVDRVAEYCKDDVRITYELYKYGRENGSVYTRDPRGRRVRVPILWT